MSITPNPGSVVSGFRLVDGADISALVAASNTQETAQSSAATLDAFRALSVVATPDDGTTQTLTAAMVTGGGATVVHVSTGGTTPSLTMPTAAAIIAAMPLLAVGGSYILRVINSNSGTATIVTNTGITMTGTLTLATNTFRDFLITRNAATTLTMVSIGTGTNS